MDEVARPGRDGLPDPASSSTQFVTGLVGPQAGRRRPGPLLDVVEGAPDRLSPTGLTSGVQTGAAKSPPRRWTRSADMDGRCVLRCPARAIVVLDVFRAAGSPIDERPLGSRTLGHAGATTAAPSTASAGAPTRRGALPANAYRRSPADRCCVTGETADRRASSAIRLFTVYREEPFNRAQLHLGQQLHTTACTRQDHARSRLARHRD
jgi:hypothetical protein